MDDTCVVKVGGSLFDLPDLRERLYRFLNDLDAERVVIVPGGGATADVIRAFDKIHQLGEEASHWLAIQALSINARFLGALLSGARLVSSPLPLYSGGEGPGVRGTTSRACAARLDVLDPLPFFKADEANKEHLPHTWDVTSDSLAVRAATVFAAKELILLKSVRWDGDDWSAARREVVVDGYFPHALANAPPSLLVRVVNLRDC